MAPLSNEVGAAPAARQKGCWTCRKRKIGCDRAVPACRNCVGTGRSCQGYGVRLAWPDKPDGRRGRNRLPEVLPAAALCGPLPESYAKHFLNVNFDDLRWAAEATVSDEAMDADEEDCDRALRRLTKPVPHLHVAAGLLGSAVASGDEGYLMAYYEDKLSRMVSTIDVNNGFRDSLLPMALVPVNSRAAEGLQNVMFALAATHTSGRGRALIYRARAVRLLSSSFLGEGSEGANTTDNAAAMVRLAVSMLLCVHSVFDESVDSDETVDDWAMHLRGARACLKDIYRDQLSRGPLCPAPPIEFGFLHTWFLYHEVLGEFSHPLSCGPEGPVSMQLLRLSSHDTSTIIGSLGCSVEVFEVMSFVNGLRAADLRRRQRRQRRNQKWPRRREDRGISTDSYSMQEAEEGEQEEIGGEDEEDPGYWDRREQECVLRAHRMASLTQVLGTDDDQWLLCYPEARVRVLNAARLYALATRIYLYSAAGATSTPTAARAPSYGGSSRKNNISSATAATFACEKAALVREALAVMSEMEVCTSPWPVFVVACEVEESEDDAQRVRILDVVERMEAARRIGNIGVLRRLIEHFWKRLSLDEDAAGKGGSGGHQQPYQGQGGRASSPSTSSSPSASPLKWWDVIDFKKEAPWFI